MRLEDARPGRIEVVLSARNVRSFAAKLDGYPPDSANTLTKVEMDPSYGVMQVVVRVEDDETHYATRGYPAGEMHPETQAQIDREKQAQVDREISDATGWPIPERR